MSKRAFVPKRLQVERMPRGFSRSSWFFQTSSQREITCFQAEARSACAGTERLTTEMMCDDMSARVSGMSVDEREHANATPRRMTEGEKGLMGPKRIARADF